MVPRRSWPEMRSVLNLFRLGPSVADRVGSPNVACVQRIRSGPCCASLSPNLPTRQTLRVCAASAFPAVDTSRDSSIRTRRGPPNVTHVMVFVFHDDFTKRYTRNGFRAFCLAGCTCLALSGRQTCVGVRAGDRTFLRRTFESQKRQ